MKITEALVASLNFREFFSWNYLAQLLKRLIFMQGTKKKPQIVWNVGVEFHNIKLNLNKFKLKSN